MKQLYTTWLLAVALTAATAASVQSFVEERRLMSEAASRSAALATSIEETVLTHYHAKRFDRIARLAERLKNNESLHNFAGLGVCRFTPPATSVAKAPKISAHAPTHAAAGIAANEANSILDLRQSRFFPSGGEAADEICKHPDVVRAGVGAHDLRWTHQSGGHSILYYAHALELSRKERGSLVLLLAQDNSYLRGVWVDSFLRTFALTALGCLALVLLIAAQTRTWLKDNTKFLHQSLRSLLAGRRPSMRQMQNPAVAIDEMKPITADIDKLAAKILSMTPKPANAVDASVAAVRKYLGARNLVVVANREPYIHNKKNDKVEVVRPASGLVTALEPILRQSGGLWIGHGGGSADRETADANGQVQVPPGKPTYTLQRVWLTPEEEEGYYYGFSNEGLWPLCHLAHTRPTFRLTDWQYYSQVNKKFCDAVPENYLNGDSLYLVQDYHYALLPRMLRERSETAGRPGEPAASLPKIGLFWHIPWPNPEAFGICPWNRELLRGMLGADVIGFHTQYHCNNFLETCNRYLEARIDWEQFSVTMENHVTYVRPFPIGIDTAPVRTISETERVDLKQKYGIHAEICAVGVDRIDYTKGLVERVEAVERFLEKNPEYIGRFALVQMGSPSRTHIPAYRALAQELEGVVERVNQRFGDRTRYELPEGYKPIYLLAQHHEWNDIQYFYQLGDICMVTSLHDGMNLVAKEYVWCQSPERGSLILSRFTGACRELTEAFVVNPYAIEEMADAIKGAVSLTPEEKAARMSAMREKIRNRSAYHWAADLIEALVKKDDTATTQPGLTTQDSRSETKIAVPFGA